MLGSMLGGMGRGCSLPGGITLFTHSSYGFTVLLSFLALWRVSLSLIHTLCVLPRPNLPLHKTIVAVIITCVLTAAK
jgi:hypothetical protein